jgi:Leucine-rich repeat (LRR) protein
VLAGGPTFDYVLKSKVVKLDLASDLLTTQTQLLEVRLASINLKSIVADLPSMLPSNLMSLNLGNTLLSSFPSHLGTLANLEELYGTAKHEQTDGRG